MAKMHSRKKGKSGSKKPLRKSMPSWSRYKPKEIELLVMKLAKDGYSASLIGTMLRDTYGVVSVRSLTKKKITKILEEKKLLPKVPENLKALIKKEILLRKHLEANKQDLSSLRGLQLTVSKINRLVKYYKRTKRLQLDWKYDPAKASMYIE
ncbi:30S ribosomal protein S15 [Candidatus Woesearchaeota archaeon]|nr:30S ribosomal protein S15 [Candidatus Woesearchaeota archaeon]